VQYVIPEAGAEASLVSRPAVDTAQVVPCATEVIGDGLVLDERDHDVCVGSGDQNSGPGRRVDHSQ
jgi:hypothetical protein